MIPAIFKAVSFASATALLMTHLSKEDVTLATVAITTVAGLVAQVIKDRNQGIRDDKRHKYEKEARDEAAAVRASIDNSLIDTKRQLADARRELEVNTQLTRASLAQDRIAAAGLRADTQGLRADIAENTQGIRADIAENTQAVRENGKNQT